MNNKKGKSLCFFSAKGGVGKTTNIINLAGVISQLDKKVLLIDLDLYSGAIAASLNIKAKKSVFNVADDLKNNRFTEIKEYVAPATENIDILCAPIDPRDSAKIDVKYLKEIIGRATFSYDTVLVDTNHALTDISLTAVSATDEILFLTTNDPMDLKNMKSLLSIFNDLEYTNYKVLLNNSRDPFKDYFTMYDIKSIIKHNIDYTLSKELFMKDIERNVMNGEIITLDKKFPNVMTKDYQTYLVIATDLLGSDTDA